MRQAQLKIHAPPPDGNTNTTRITATPSPGIVPARSIMARLENVGHEPPTPVKDHPRIAA